MSPAPVFVRIPGSHHPGTRLRLVPGFRDPGSVLILGQVTQYGNPYLICITHGGDGARRRNVGYNRHCTLNELAKHSHPLNHISDKLYNIVTGNLLQSNSIIQMQVIGARIKGQFITNFKDGFYQIIWNPVKSLEVMLTVGQVWQMELVLIFQYKPRITNHLSVNMDAFAMGQNLHWYIN